MSENVEVDITTSQSHIPNSVKEMSDNVPCAKKQVNVKIYTAFYTMNNKNYKVVKITPN